MSYTLLAAVYIILLSFVNMLRSCNVTFYDIVLPYHLYTVIQYDKSNYLNNSFLSISIECISFKRLADN